MHHDGRSFRATEQRHRKSTTRSRLRRGSQTSVVVPSPKSHRTPFSDCMAQVCDEFRPQDEI